ncbi:hypothetical protein HMPREF1486_06209 [Streptomyces sp. HPH0547]|nr:hypothetical protein HMPREF1486_06209 [Streptomyces sp. HPH0547]
MPPVSRAVDSFVPLRAARWNPYRGKFYFYRQLGAYGMKRAHEERESGPVGDVRARIARQVQKKR